MKKTIAIATLGVCAFWAVLIVPWVMNLDRYPMDSYYYLLLGDSLAHGDGYALVGEPHERYAPGYPVHIAALELTGLSPEASARALSVLFGAATIGLAMLLAARWFGGFEAAVTAMLLAASPMFGRWCIAPMSEPMFAFYSLLALGLAARAANARRWTACAAVFLLGGGAVLVRFTGVVLLPAILLAALGGKFRNRSGKETRTILAKALALGAVFLVPLGLWLVRNKLALGSSTAMDYLNYDRAIREPSASFFFEQLRFCLVSFPLADLLTPTVPPWFRLIRGAFLATYWAGFAWGTTTAWRIRRPEVLALSLWVVLIHLFHVFWPFREERFFMPAFPAVAMLTAFGVGTLAWRGTEAPDDAGAARRMKLAGGFVGIWAAFLLACSPVIYRMQEIGLEVQSTARLAETAGKQVGALIGPTDRVATPLNPVEMLYFLRHWVEPVREQDDLRRVVESYTKTALSPGGDGALGSLHPTAAALGAPPTLWILLPNSWWNAETRAIFDKAQGCGLQVRASSWWSSSHGNLWAVHIFWSDKNPVSSGSKL